MNPKVKKTIETKQASSGKRRSYDIECEASNSDSYVLRLNGQPFFFQRAGIVAIEAVCKEIRTLATAELSEAEESAAKAEKEAQETEKAKAEAEESAAKAEKEAQEAEDAEAEAEGSGPEDDGPEGADETPRRGRGRPPKNPQPPA